MAIHPTAIVDKTAEVDPTAEIGAYAVIENDVRVGPQTRIYPHAYVAQGTTLGRACQIHPFAVVGHLPQDLKYDGGPSYTQIGAETVIREHATVHRGTERESTTIIGARCFIMSAGHVGHNCVVGEDVIIVNGGLLAGHVEMGRRAFVSAGAKVHQFVRIGELVMLRGGSLATNDVPPFMTLGPPGVIGPNVVGLRRAGLDSDERQEIRWAYKTLYRSGLLFREAIDQVAETVKRDPGRRLVEFLRAASKRGFAGFRKARSGVPVQELE